MSPPTLALDGRTLTIADVVRAARDHRVRVTLDPAARSDLVRSRGLVEAAIASGQTIYGINTGFGKLANVRIAPDQLDFGTLSPGCATREREVTIINVCDEQLTLRPGTADPIEIAPGPSDEFHTVTTPMPGTRLNRGEQAVFTLSYIPQDEGTDLGIAYIWVNGIDEPYVAELKGRGAENAMQVDSFRRQSKWLMSWYCSVFASTARSV